MSVRRENPSGIVKGTQLRHNPTGMVLTVKEVQNAYRNPEHYNIAYRSPVHENKEITETIIEGEEFFNNCSVIHTPTADQATYETATDTVNNLKEIVGNIYDWSKKMTPTAQFSTRDRERLRKAEKEVEKAQRYLSELNTVTLMPRVTQKLKYDTQYVLLDAIRPLEIGCLVEVETEQLKWNPLRMDGMGGVKGRWISHDPKRTTKTLYQANDMLVANLMNPQSEWNVIGYKTKHLYFVTIGEPLEENDWYLQSNEGELTGPHQYKPQVPMVRNRGQRYRIRATTNRDTCLYRLVDKAVTEYVRRYNNPNPTPIT